MKKDEIEKIKCYLKSISPNSEVIATSFSKVNIKDILSVKRFDLETAEKDAKWIMEKEKIEDIP